MATTTNATYTTGTALPPGCGYSAITPTSTGVSTFPSQISQTLYNGLPPTPTNITFEAPAYFNKDIEINGRKLSEILDKIEERLNMISPNTKLEAEWEELRVLGEQYRQLEKEILQKMAVYNELKK